MTLQELLNQASHFSEQTITLQDMLYHPVAWAVAYILFMLTFGLAKTKSYAQTYTDPIGVVDHFGTFLLLILSPIWVILGIPAMLLFNFACSTGKNIIGR